MALFTSKKNSTAEWVEEPNTGFLPIMHRGGVSWIDAPCPPRWHTCRPQTQGFMMSGRVLRCACGAISDNGRWWMERNSRRKTTRRRR